EPRRVRRRPPQRASAHGVRARRAHLPRRTAGPGRGQGRGGPLPPAGAEPPHLRGPPRPGRRPPLHLPAHVHPARAREPAPRVRPDRLRLGSTRLTPHPWACVPEPLEPTSPPVRPWRSPTSADAVPAPVCLDGFPRPDTAHRPHTGGARVG